jgi:methionine-rich copper-binding protein CopC
MRSIITSHGAALAAALVTALATWLVPAPASAHANFVGAIPAPNATVATAPTNVRVFFSSAIRAEGSAMTVIGPGGGRVDLNDSAAQPDPNRQTLRVSLMPSLGPGEYAVNWNNVADDGHPESGSFKFLVNSTPVSPAGGRNFALSSQSSGVLPTVHLTWTDGTQEDNYQLIRLVPNPVQTFNLPGNAASYTDTMVLPGQLYCYILVPRSGNTPLGNTNGLCVLVGISTVGEVPPGPDMQEVLARVLEALE